MPIHHASTWVQDPHVLALVFLVILPFLYLVFSALRENPKIAKLLPDFLAPPSVAAKKN